MTSPIITDATAHSVPRRSEDNAASQVLTVPIGAGSYTARSSPTGGTGAPSVSTPGAVAGEAQSVGSAGDTYELEVTTPLARILSHKTAPTAASPYAYEHVGLDDYVSRACPECEGVGEIDVLALDATSAVVEYCDNCGGTGKIAVYCQCGEPVTGGAPDGDNGVCHSCELVFHRDEREPADLHIMAMKAEVRL